MQFPKLFNFKIIKCECICRVHIFWLYFLLYECSSKKSVNGMSKLNLFIIFRRLSRALERLSEGGGMIARKRRLVNNNS